MEETYQVFERAARGKSGEEALRAMGEAYTELIEDRDRLQLMLQCFADCDDPDVREAVRGVWRRPRPTSSSGPPARRPKSSAPSLRRACC